MSAQSFHLSATRAYRGVVLNGLFFSVLSWLVYLSACFSIMHLSLLKEDLLPMIIAIVLWAFTLHIISEFNRKVMFDDKRPDTGDGNLALLLSSDMVRELANEKGKNSFSLLRAAVLTQRGEFILSEMGIDKKKFLDRFEYEVHKQIDLHDFLSRAEALRGELSEARISANIIIYLFFQYGDEFQDFLNEQDLSQDDLKNIMQWEQFHYEWEHEMHTWHPSNLLRMFGTIGRGWVMGYTSELDTFTTDMSEHVLLHKERKVVIHKKEIKNVLHVLSRAQDQNVLLLGRPGVGKQTLIENITYAIRRNEEKHSIPFTRVLLLHTEQLLAGAEKPDTVLLSALNYAAKAGGRFILIIDNLSLLLKSDNKAIIGVLLKFLKAPNMSLLAVADARDYHVLVKKDPMIDELFERVQVDEASEQEAMLVMMMHYFNLEEKQRIHVTYRALKSILELSKRYIAQEGFPGKAIAVMNDAVISARQHGRKTVTDDDVREMVSLKAHMNVQEISDDEREGLLHLEETLKKQIIGQDPALAALTNALKRARMDIHTEDRPLGTFLFLGPTGVGKTQTAKVLAEQYYGSKGNIIRLDMNEYSNDDSIKLLVGSPDVSNELSEGYMARRVQDKPFSLILLDEIEKAHPKVINVFLQILDEGQLTDNLGIKTDFRNTIIIATSNAGALFIREFVKKHGAAPKEEFKKILIDTIIKEKIFAPEFVNRFDEVVLYHPLSMEDAKKISMLMLDDVIADLQKKKGIALKIEEGVTDAIVERGYSAEFGAREMRRTIVDMVENYIADYMLKNEVKRGDEITIHRSDLTI